MSAMLIIRLTLTERKWLRTYWEGVQAILADHGAVLVASSNEVERIEGDQSAPDRIILFTFPSTGSIRAFFDDPRYVPWKVMRQEGGHAEILAFENAYGDGPLG